MVIVKAVAGFMNSECGTLLIGIMDDGHVFGIESDLNTSNRIAVLKGRCPVLALLTCITAFSQMKNLKCGSRELLDLIHSRIGMYEQSFSDVMVILLN